MAQSKLEGFEFNPKWITKYFVVKNESMVEHVSFKTDKLGFAALNEHQIVARLNGMGQELEGNKDFIKKLRKQRSKFSYCFQEENKDNNDLRVKLAAQENENLELREMLESKLDLIRCGIGSNYSGDPYENKLYKEVKTLLTKQDQ